MVPATPCATNSAQKGTRTPTVLPPLVPETSASTKFRHLGDSHGGFAVFRTQPLSRNRGRSADGWEEPIWLSLS